MKNATLYLQLSEARLRGEKWLAVLIDPEEIKDRDALLSLAGTCQYAGVNVLLVGGSLVNTEKHQQVINWLKETTTLPVVLFPGNNMQVYDKADALLFLSLISGRNADLLIGQHVLAAPVIDKTNLEIISCGYMLIDGGKPTSVSYISHTLPIPADKPSIAVATAMAGEMLGLKTLYLEAGSGALNPVPIPMIEAVRKKVKVPIIVGGGIRTREKMQAAWNAGADMVVIGTAIEKDADWLLNHVSAHKPNE